jgi:hypothetical protein
MVVVVGGGEVVQAARELGLQTRAQFPARSSAAVALPRGETD